MSRWIGFAVIAVSLISCAKKAADEHVGDTPRADKVSIRYDSDVPGEQRSLIEDDLDTLSKLNLTENNAEYAKIIGVDKTDAVSLNRWLADRMKVIVAEGYKPLFYNSEGRVSSIDSAKLRGLRRFTGTPEAFSDFGLMGPLSAVTNAENIGGAVYLYCKEEGFLCEMTLQDGTKIEVNTPRISVMRIGEGLFSPRIDGPKNGRCASFVRLGTIFHEAGHTLGNGADACFPHAVCPTGHNYAGNAACDMRTNGPYPIGVTVLKILSTRVGEECNARQKEQMRLIIVDYDKRLLPGHQFKDARSERITN